MNYPITDSVLRRHYQQHLSAGGTELAGVTLTDNVHGGSGDHRGAADNRNSAVGSGHAANSDSGSKSGSSGFLKILIPLIILGLLGWLAMKFMNKDAAVDSDGMSTTTEASATVGDASAVGDQLSGFFKDTTASLNGITDVDSANAAVPTLTSLGENLDGIGGSIDSVPEAARGPLTKIVTDGSGSLGPIADKLYAIPGVEDIIKPLLGPIMEKLQGLAG